MSIEIKSNQLLYQIYNEAYQNYLKNEEPTKFMTKLLREIVIFTDSKSGIIIYNENSNIEAQYNFPLENLEKMDYRDDFKDIFYQDNIIYVPIIFSQITIALICLVNMNISNEIYYYELTLLGNLLGSLIHLYKNNKELGKYNLLNCDLVEILNQIGESIIITESNFNIIHKNYEANRFLNIFRDEISNNFLEYFPKLKNLESKYFKNNKIRLTCVNNHNNNIVIDLFINSIMRNNNIHHIIIPKEEKICSEKNQNNIIAFLSHELRNPLQSIVLSSYLLNNKLKNNSDEKIKSQINIINKSSNDMKRIINDILDLSKIEADEINLELDLCNIKDIITNIYQEYDILANEKNLTINFKINDDVPEKIFTDQVRLNQILSNLVSNAVKYTNKGNIIIDVCYCEQKNGVYFNITDTGIGIKNDEVCFLFKEFGVTNSNYNKNTSNGLGLYLSQKLAKLLGGNITYLTEYGNGSTFSLFHPIKLGTSEILYSGDNIQFNLKGKLLLIDDDETNLIILKMLLENFVLEYNFDLEMESTTDGYMAIELCKINCYDIIFIDINMIGIDGCTAAKIIKKNNCNNIIIAMTGNILAKKENRTENSKFEIFSHVIIKPFNDIIMLNILGKYLKNNDKLNIK